MIMSTITWLLFAALVRASWCFGGLTGAGDDQISTEEFLKDLKTLIVDRGLSYDGSLGKMLIQLAHGDSNHASEPDKNAIVSDVASPEMQPSELDSLSLWNAGKTLMENLLPSGEDSGSNIPWIKIEDNSLSGDGPDGASGGAGIKSSPELSSGDDGVAGDAFSDADENHVSKSGANKQSTSFTNSLVSKMNLDYWKNLNWKDYFYNPMSRFSG